MTYQRKKTGNKNKFKKTVADFKMLQFGVFFLDENDGKADFKVKAILYSEDSKNQPCVRDESNNVVEEYTREEAAELVAKALVLGRGISGYLFDNEDSWGGNARIDISGIELDNAETEVVAPKTTAKRSYKKTVEVEEEADEYDEESPY